MSRKLRRNKKALVYAVGETLTSEPDLQRLIGDRLLTVAILEGDKLWPSYYFRRLIELEDWNRIVTQMRDRFPVGTVLSDPNAVNEFYDRLLGLTSVQLTLDTRSGSKFYRASAPEANRTDVPTELRNTANVADARLQSKRRNDNGN